MEKDKKVISQQDRIGTLILSGILTALGIFWIIAAMHIDARVEFGVLNLASFPIAAGGFLSAMSAILFIHYLRLPSQPAKKLGLPPLIEPESWRRIIFSVIVLVIYIFFLEKIHYLITTFFLISAGMALFGEPLRLRLVIFAAIVSLLLYLIFLFMLSVPLPGSRYV